jgi:hypothetical protein
MNEPNQARPSPAAPAEEGKKPYEKPGIAWEEPLEVRPALMTVCNKIVFGQGTCDAATAS